MPILPPTAPSSQLALVEMTVQGLVADGLVPPALAGASPNELSFESDFPAEIYTFSPEQIIALEPPFDQDGTSNVELIGWRYLIRRGGKAVAAADLQSSEVSEVLSGDFVEGTLAAIETARQLVEGLDPDTRFELRMLWMPEVYVTAVWLTGSHGQVNLLLPVAPAPPELKLEFYRSWTEFLEPLIRTAREQLAFAQHQYVTPSAG